MSVTIHIQILGISSIEILRFSSFLLNVKHLSGVLLLPSTSLFIVLYYLFIFSKKLYT